MHPSISSLLLPLFFLILKHTWPQAGPTDRAPSNLILTFPIFSTLPNPFPHVPYAQGGPMMTFLSPPSLLIQTPREELGRNPGHPITKAESSNAPTEPQRQK